MLQEEANLLRAVVLQHDAKQETANLLGDVVQQNTNKSLCEQVFYMSLNRQ